MERKTDYCEHCGTLFDKPGTVLSYGNVTLTDNKVLIDGMTYHISTKALLILRVFFQRKSITKDSLFAAVWGSDSEVEIKSVDVYLTRIRRFLREIGADFEILSNWGVGYQLRLFSEPQIAHRHIHKTPEPKPEPAPRPKKDMRAWLQARRERRKSFRR